MALYVRKYYFVLSTELRKTMRDAFDDDYLLAGFKIFEEICGAWKMGRFLRNFLFWRGLHCNTWRFEMTKKRI